jgi:hypothetical protein
VLTPRGRAAVESARRLQVGWANDIAEGLDAAELDSAVAVVRELRRRLGDRSVT